MILTGVGGSLLSHSSRRQMLRVSAVCVLVTGLISLGRGVMLVQFPGSACSSPAPSASSGDGRIISRGDVGGAS